MVANAVACTGTAAPGATQPPVMPAPVSRASQVCSGTVCIFPSSAPRIDIPRMRVRASAAIPYGASGPAHVASVVPAGGHRRFLVQFQGRLDVRCIAPFLGDLQLGVPVAASQRFRDDEPTDGRYRPAQWTRDG